MNQQEHNEQTHGLGGNPDFPHSDTPLLRKVASKKNVNSSRIIRIKEVISRTGLSRGGIYARISREEFPKSIGLGGRAVGWLESDIDAWIHNRIMISREVA